MGGLFSDVVWVVSIVRKRIDVSYLFVSCARAMGFVGVCYKGRVRGVSYPPKTGHARMNQIALTIHVIS